MFATLFCFNQAMSGHILPAILNDRATLKLSNLKGSWAIKAACTLGRQEFIAILGFVWSSEARWFSQLETSTILHGSFGIFQPWCWGLVPHCRRPFGTLTHDVWRLLVHWLYDYTNIWHISQSTSQHHYVWYSLLFGSHLLMLKLPVLYIKIATCGSHFVGLHRVPWCPLMSHVPASPSFSLR